MRRAAFWNRLRSIKSEYFIVIVQMVKKRRRKRSKKKGHKKGKSYRLLNKDADGDLIAPTAIFKGEHPEKVAETAWFANKNKLGDATAVLLIAVEDGTVTEVGIDRWAARRNGKWKHIGKKKTKNGLDQKKMSFYDIE